MIRRRISAAVALALAAQFGAMGQAPAQTAAPRAAIDAIFKAYTATTPGCAVGVEQAGKTLFEAGYGAADLATGRALTPQSSFYMASVSKQLTAMAVLSLVEDGRLRLSDSVRKAIPELPPYADKVTIGALLTHTSGVRDYFTLGEIDGLPPEQIYTEDLVLKLLKEQRGLSFEPGSDFLYSNSGYVLLAIVVQRVSGKRLDDYARGRIFTPLKMDGTRFQHDHNNPIPRKANGYGRDTGGAWTVENSMLDVVGDGGLYSSVDDMLKWLANLDHPKFGAKSLAIMRTSAKLSDGSSTGYGMGLSESRYRGLDLVAHGGALAGYRTSDWWFPQQKLGIVVLCNRADAQPDQLAGKVAEAYIGAQMSRPAAPAVASTPEPPEPFVGLYRDRGGVYQEFAARQGTLTLARPNLALVAVAPHTFVIKTNPAGPRFTFDAASGGLTIASEGQPTRNMQRVTPRSLDAAGAAPYLGDYASTEVRGVVHIRHKTGLTLSVREGPDMMMVQTGPDRFWAPVTGVELVFTRTPAGGVSGFTLDAGRARGIVFSRAP